MLDSSGAERCLLAPRNINDSNDDDELTWRSWGSRKQVVRLLPLSDSDLGGDLGLG
eukprot:SAG25_NODE_3199_length_1177_cov_1.655844_1_plen_55_part_01